MILEIDKTKKSNLVIYLYKVTLVVSDYILLTFIFQVPQSCPTAQQFLPNLQLPQQNLADSGTNN